MIQNDPPLPFKRQCWLLNLNRNTAYYQLNYSKQKQRQQEDLKIKEEIDKIHYDFPYYGYRSLTEALKREGFNYNEKRVLRIARTYGLLSQIKKLFKTQSKHPHKKYPNLLKGLKIEKPNDVWGSDITYIKLPNGFVYLAVVIDLFTRKVRGWCLSKSLTAEITKNALLKALTKNQAPQIHHSDQGVQYCEKEYLEILEKHQIRISMSDKANPFQNNIVESFFKTLKYNEIYLNEYSDFNEALDNIEKFIEIVYDKKRLHSSLGYLPPDEFEKKYYQEQAREQILTLEQKNGFVECFVSPLKNQRWYLRPL